MTEQQNPSYSKKKEVLESVFNVFENVLEVVSSITGGSSSVATVLLPIMELLLDNVDSKEVRFADGQIKKLNNRLEVVSAEIQQLNNEMKRRLIDVTYYQVERNLNDQFRLFIDIFKVKDQEVRKKMFIDYFEINQGKKNLDILFNAVTGEFGASVLEIVLNYEQKSRRPVERFCAMLKQLFCVGLIALLGYEKLTCSGKEETVRQEWDEKMNMVQSKMDKVIEECINSFPTQADLDAMYIVKSHSVESNQELADLLLFNLKKKYDWVCWSVRVFNSPTGLFDSKKVFHGLAGKSWFKVAVSDEKLNVIVSYSASPEPVKKARIKNLVQDQNTCICKRPSVARMADQLFETIPHCVVHTIKMSCKDLGFSCSFSDECHYYGKFKNFNVFVHSENGEAKIEKS